MQGGCADRTRTRRTRRAQSVAVTLGAALLLFPAGLLAGILGSTAGLASLASYPALLLAGLSPVAANVTNTVALLGSSMGSILGSRVELRGQGPAVRRWLPWAVVSGAAGAGLLLVTPPGSFELVVPFLIAGASVLLICAPRIRARATAKRAAAGLEEGHHRSMARLTAPLVAAWIYSGYFGAAAGVVVLAVLLAGTDSSLPRANALKNLVLAGSNGIAAITFAIFADVHWTAVVTLGLGCAVGGWIGPAIVRRVSPAVLRWLIGLAGIGLAIKLWFG